MRKQRFYKIDVALVGKPELREQMVKLAQEKGVTIRTMRAALTAAGVSHSHGSAARWMRHQRSQASQLPRGLLAPVIRRVVGMSERELVKLADYLGINANVAA